MREREGMPKFVYLALDDNAAVGKLKYRRRDADDDNAREEHKK